MIPDAISCPFAATGTSGGRGKDAIIRTATGKKRKSQAAARRDNMLQGK